MSSMLLTSAVFYRIQNGIVYCESASGDESVHFAMPIAHFRASIAAAQQALVEFDADCRVIMLRG